MKKKKISAYQKATNRMEQEVNRALAHVHNLEKLYKQSKKQKTKLP